MLGIVLCGGSSSRMGQDKGLLTTDHGNWSAMMLENFRQLSIPVALSVNHKQVEQYTRAFKDVELISDNDNFLLKGPLAAVLSINGKYPEEDLFIIACDMALMKSFVLKELYNTYLKVSEKQGYVFTNDGEPEPLCGIYTANGIAHIKQLYERGQLLKHSMKFMLDHLIMCRIPIPEDWKICFRNFNAHADLNGQ